MRSLVEVVFGSLGRQAVEGCEGLAGGPTDRRALKGVVSIVSRLPLSEVAASRLPAITEASDSISIHSIGRSLGLTIDDAQPPTSGIDRRLER